jgi:hypothetical protein
MQWKGEWIGVWPMRSHENKLQEAQVQQMLGVHKNLCCELHHKVFYMIFLAQVQS